MSSIVAIALTALLWQGCASQKTATQHEIRQSTEMSMTYMKQLPGAEVQIKLPIEQIKALPEHIPIMNRRNHTSIVAVRKGDSITLTAKTDSIPVEINSYRQSEKRYKQLAKSSSKQRKSPIKASIAFLTGILFTAFLIKYLSKPDR